MSLMPWAIVIPTVFASAPKDASTLIEDGISLIASCASSVLPYVAFAVSEPRVWFAV